MENQRSKILVINSGSSSLKYNLFNHVNQKSEELEHVKNGNINIGRKESPKNHSEALKQVLKVLQEEFNCGKDDILFVAHRVVHGAEEFAGKDTAVIVNEEVLKKIEELSQLAPLHNPINAIGIKECIKLFENVPQIAVFDTSFHQTIPPHAYKYAIPSFLSQKLRKYGFHGTSHRYVAERAAQFLEKSLADLKLITLHLGNGCSACAISGGKSIDTSMGLTPLEGLVMGTRSGDLDPAIVFHLMDTKNETIDWNSSKESFLKIEDILNRESGLKGLCGSSDMRDIQRRMMEQKDEKAKLAFDVFCYRIKKYIGGYFVVMNGCDAIVFTAGIGENSDLVRSQVCKDMECISLELDESKNQSFTKSNEKIADISKKSSKVKVLVVFTDEEMEIAMLGKKKLKSSNHKLWTVTSGANKTTPSNS